MTETEPAEQLKQIHAMMTEVAELAHAQAARADDPQTVALWGAIQAIGATAAALAVFMRATTPHITIPHHGTVS